MIKILIRNGFRSLIKQMPYSFVNILGLTIGVASVLVLIIWVSVETSYDKFHKDQERLYRVSMIFKTPNKDMNIGSINAPAGPEFKREFPVIEEMVRIDPEKESAGYYNKFSQLNALYTDKTFFDIFSFDILKGDKKTCLESPQSIILTEKAVKKIFGSEDPLGKGIQISGYTFIVSAVAKDPPVNTNLQFECLLPFSIKENRSHVGWDGGLTCYTYLKLIKGSDPSKLEKQILEYMEGVINKKYREFGYQMIPYLQKISDIHLDSKTDSDMGEKGSRTQVFMFSGIGLLILLIACFNFVNISTALISIRKINGATISDVFRKFNFELLKWILVSFVIATPLGYFAMNKWLNNFVYKTTISLWLVIISGLFALVISLITVSWASNKAARTNPAETLRKD